VEGVPKIAWNLGLERDKPNVAKVLQENGYRTGFVGKWHVGGISDHFERVPEGSDPADPSVDRVLKANQQGYCQRIRDRYGFSYAGAVYNGNPDDDRSLVHSGCNVHNMEWLTRAAFEFLESVDDQPFYLYFAPTLLHSPSPLASLKEDPRKSGEGWLDQPVNGLLPTRESVIERTLSAGFPEEAAGATWLDDVIGALMGKLDELGLAENTLVIYFNDNGMETKAKGSCYEGGIHIPVMFRWPGTLEPGTRDDFISNIDFVPTIFELCGVEKPENMKLDGRSLVPLLEGETPADWRTSVYSEIGYTRSVTTKDWKFIAFKVPPSVNRTREERVAEYRPYYQEQVKNNPWLKERFPFNPEAPYYQIGIQAGGYVWEWYRLDPNAPWLENYFDADQLYHLSEDPFESVNLASDRAYAEKLTEMKGLLRKHLESVPGKFGDMLD
jgi:arylsulfatase A-like enzyme